MQVPQEDVDKKVTSKQKAKISRRITEALKWAGSRTGSITASLHLELSALQALQGKPGAMEALIAALSERAQLRQLRCLETRLLSPSSADTALGGLSLWLLSQSPGLEILSIRQGRFHLNMAAVSFQHMKHLFVSAGAIQDLPADITRQMPVLESLFLQGLDTEVFVERIDVSECQRLRHLALAWARVRKLIRGPACRLSVDLRIFSDDSFMNSDFWTSEVASHLGTAQHLGLSIDHMLLAPPGEGLFTLFPCMEVLNMYWPGPDVPANPEPGPLMHAFVLAMSMPGNGMPLANLKTIMIHGFRVACFLPAGLPKLEELVILSDSWLALDFEDQAATFRNLKTFYAFGQPLIWTEYNVLHRYSSAWLACGMTLDVESVLWYSGRCKYKESSRCVYLKPVSQRQSCQSGSCMAG